MNWESSLEDRLEALGVELRARPRLTAGVLDELSRSEFEVPRAEDMTTDLSEVPTSSFARSRRRFITVAASALATLAAVLVIAIALLPAPSVSWADVTKAIGARPWIRGRTTLEGIPGRTSFEGHQTATMWMSAERDVWAFRSPDACYFFDGRDRAKYEYRTGDKKITKLPLGEENIQRVLPLAALSQDKSTIGPWLFGTEKIMEQERVEVEQDGKTWIDFHLVLRRAETYYLTLRVDPRTRLPVYLLSTSAKNKAKSYKWEFDYPAIGPTDIYALGVSHDITIKDRLLSKEALQVLDAMTASRASIGDFRLLVNLDGELSFSPNAFLVSRKANRWRIDSCWPPADVGSPTQPAEEQNAGVSIDERLKQYNLVPLYICNGTTVWQNTSWQPGTKPQWQVCEHVYPQDLMSGDGLARMPLAPFVKFASLLYPDLWPKRGWQFSFDPSPADAPGLVLVKRSARLATAEPLMGHEWYYIDPSKGYAVVRAELLNLPIDMPADPQATKQRETIHVEDFRQAPSGFWYAATAHDTRPSSRPISKPLGKSNFRSFQSTIHYQFDFEADLPDALFTIPANHSPK